MDARRILQVLRFRWWLFALVFGLSFLLVVIIPRATESPMFLSRAKILLTPSASAGQAVATDRNASSLDPLSWASDESTLRELVTSERLLRRVLGEQADPEAWVEFQKQVVLVPLTTGDSYSRKITLFALGVEDTSPEESKRLADLLVREFVSYIEELSAKEFANTRKFLEELVAEARERVEETEEKLLRITATRADGERSKVLAENQTQLEGEKRKVREEMALVQTELAAVEGFLTGAVQTPPWSIIQQTDPGLQQLENAVSENRIKLAQLEGRYNAASEKVVEQKEQLDRVQQLYQSRLSSNVESLAQEKRRSLEEKKSRMKIIQAQLNQLQNQQLTPQQKREAAKLERQLSMWEENHLSLVKQLYQARVVEQSMRRQGAISILEAPRRGVPSEVQKRRSLGMVLAIGTPVSLCAALLVVFAVDYLTASLRIVPRVETMLGTSVLAVIPEVDTDLAATWEACKRGNLTSSGFLKRLRPKPDDLS
ncbi:hypothetical protein JST97_07500 [bacterium]|nr:hypothetical protein [bacterium]